MALTKKQRLTLLGELQFTKYTWYLYACIIATAGLINLTCLTWARWRRHKYASSTTTTAKIERGVVRPNRVPAAILTAARILAFRLRIPAVNMSLLEVLLTIMYIVVLFCLDFTNTLPYYDVSLWGNRAGHLAAIQFPLIVALSGKNNVIGMITGLSHERLNLMHRVISRVLMILVWIHLVGTYLHWQTGAHRDERFWIYSSWIVAGLLSCLAQTFLVFLSWEPIRRRFYEFFYITHMTLVIVIMICSMYHIHTSDWLFDLYASPYFWPSFVVWGVDRAGRLLRVLLLNTVFKSSKASIAQNQNLGSLDLVTSDTLLITVKRSIPRGLKWRPGQHMFVAFPSLAMGQSHPFTIASVVSTENDVKEQELVFIARVREGATRKLKDRVLEVGTCDVPVILDGPYGAPADITPFSTCVFIAGGSGITYTLPRFEDLVSELNKGNACARRIVFIWAIRERSHMRWVASRLVSSAALVPSHVSLSISVFITSHAPPAINQLSGGTSTPTSEEGPGDDVEKKGGSGDEDESSEDGSDLPMKFDRIEVYRERPDLKKILEEEVEAAAGPVTVDVSGPDSLLATTRSALSSGFAGPLSVLRGAPTVQLNVEAFSM